MFDPTHTSLFSTYSIVARDAESGQFGIAVQTHQMGVGFMVPWLQAGVGAVATQSLVNISFGPMGLAMLHEGVAAERVVDALVASDPGADSRQLGVVDAQGNAAAWTGAACIAYAAHHVGEGYTVQANMMERDSVISAMSKAYEAASGDLASRMLATLQAAQQEGGDIRGMQSAALRVVSGDPQAPEYSSVYDLRVDESGEPLAELVRLARLRHAQLIGNEGFQALHNQDLEGALALWAKARDRAPELEELAFWQAVTLADGHADLERAAAILNPMLSLEALRREQWIDLLHRLQACGIIKRAGAAQELVNAL